MQRERSTVVSRAPLRWLPAAALLLTVSLAGARAAAFGFEDVAREAADLARSAYRSPPPADPRLAALSYDEYRQLRFRPDVALWRDAGTPFDVRFYALGRGNTRPLRLFELVDGAVRPIEVPASAFSSPALAIDAAAGAAGWRMNYPLNSGERRDELISFLGSSYFRALGSGQRYGLSARGLAIDSASGRGEEFPVFTSFWLQRPVAAVQVGGSQAAAASGTGAAVARSDALPAAEATEAIFYALLDSPSTAGAYRFAIRPGLTTTVDVQARLYPRPAAALATFGIAPLTSMFLSGENQPTADDYRPEVHDSDGLQVQTADGEWIWRPLTNPRGPFTTSFAMRAAPRGFGLMQRDRAFGSYEDLEANYESRPSVWVEPLGDWGPGRVELLQFGTPDETHDNVVAYWVPQRHVSAGTPLDFSWRLHWSGADAVMPPGAHVVQSRRGHGYREAAIPEQHMQFHIDFAGAGLQGLKADEVEAQASGNDNVRDLRAIAYPNTARGGWRVSLAFERIDPRRPVELRTFLRSGQRTLSETWSYALAPV